jgi:hypothetical protein
MRLIWSCGAEGIDAEEDEDEVLFEPKRAITRFIGE